MCQIWISLDTRGTQVRVPICLYLQLLWTLYIKFFGTWGRPISGRLFLHWQYNKTVTCITAEICAPTQHGLRSRFEKLLTYNFTNSSLKLDRWPNRGSRESPFAHILIVACFNAACCVLMSVKWPSQATTCRTLCSLRRTASLTQQFDILFDS